MYERAWNSSQSESEQHGGTWLSADLYDYFEKLAQDDCRVKVVVVELCEKEEVAAVIVALASGCIFHDVTMATLIRDERSAGHLLTKCLGYQLQQCGFKYWYWGFKNPYMDDYKSYNPVFIDRNDFWPLWDQETIEFRADGDSWCEWR